MNSAYSMFMILKRNNNVTQSNIMEKNNITQDVNKYKKRIEELELELLKCKQKNKSANNCNYCYNNNNDYHSNR